MATQMTKSALTLSQPSFLIQLSAQSKYPSPGRSVRCAGFQEAYS